MLPHTAERAQRVVPPAVALEIVAHRIWSLARLDHQVDQPHLLQLVGVVDPAAQHQLVRPRAVEPPAQQAVRPHPREKVEQDLRQTELGASLGDDHVAAQHGLEAAAQGIAMHHGDGEERQVALDQVVIDGVDAGVGVAPELGFGARADQPREQGEIAAEVPDSGHGRGPDHAAQGHAGGVGRPGQPLLDTGLQGSDLVEQPRREAGPLGMVEHAPQGALIGFEPDRELGELRVQRAEVQSARQRRPRVHAPRCPALQAGNLVRHRERRADGDHASWCRHEFVRTSP